jgi:hypothetical protein
MRILLAVAILFSLCKNACAQQTKSYIVKAGEQISDVLPPEAIYVFPAFKSGLVFMRDGTISTAKLNYNVLLNEMQFIDSKGDTMAIAYPETVKYISIDTLFYYYDKTYLQVVSQVDSFKLAVKQWITQSPYRTRGGYDAPTATSSITTYSSITSNGSRGNLQVKKDVKLEKDSSYFISDKFNHFYKADKKAFLNIFPMKKDSILDYISKNNINFSNKDDIEKLLRFCLY